MSNLILKHYFLEEIERIRIEDALLNCHSEREDDFLEMDDCEILDLYHKYVKGPSLAENRQF
ncbi:hypothetical protein [Priestia abyssalis]|uniref:hypothetical protein n=1 Tax=Priestia abyssalis TaxID=1221450 RepID=UPI000995589B|nr:hypothetical protein [Priestia abyssalis]